MGSQRVGHNWVTDTNTKVMLDIVIIYYLLNIVTNYTTKSPILPHQFSSVQSFSHVWLFATPWIAARHASLSITNSQSSPKLMSIKSVMPSILSHPLSSPSPPAPPPSQHQGLFKCVNSSPQVATVLEFQPQHQSFQWIPRTGLHPRTGWISLQSKGLSRVFSNTTV